MKEGDMLKPLDEYEDGVLAGLPPEHIEREERYLVHEYDTAVLELPAVAIEQGYLTSSPGNSLRVRIEDERCVSLARKIGRGRVRGEIPNPQPVGVENGRYLLDATDLRIKKQRRRLDGWEIDAFGLPLDGITLAEFEFRDPETQVVLPSWIKRATRVTDSLNNFVLAVLAKRLRAMGTTNRPASDFLLPNLPHIVLAGGPGSGKTAAMEFIRDKFGTTIQCVPEVATILIGQVGIKPFASDNPLHGRVFQEQLYAVQSALEAAALWQAVADQRSALLMDRGTVDGAAYLPGGVQEFERLLGTRREIEYKRYQAVIFIGPPPQEVYERIRANNPARSEDYATACRRSVELHAAWHDHPNFNFVPNRGSWADTLACLFDTLTACLTQAKQQLAAP